MQDRLVREPIDIDRLDSQRERDLEQLVSIRLLLETKLTPTGGWMDFMGEALVGQAKRRVVGENGQITEVPWTLSDLVAATNEIELANEKSMREEFASEIEMGLSAQEAFFTRSRSKIKERALNTVQFGRILVQRYLARELEIRDRYFKQSPDFKYDEETLEQLAEVLLPKVPGLAREGSVKRSVELSRLSERTGKEWAVVVGKEAKIFLKFIQDISGGTAAHVSKLADIMERMVRGDQRVYTDEQVARVREAGIELKADADKIAQMSHFDELLPRIKDKFGSGADYTSLPLVGKEEDQASVKTELQDNS